MHFAIILCGNHSPTRPFQSGPARTACLHAAAPNAPIRVAENHNFLAGSTIDANRVHAYRDILSIEDGVHENK